METIILNTAAHTVFTDITSQIKEAVAKAGIKQGLCCVFVPHTTAGITINENADPDVVNDVIAALDKNIPWKNDFYRHAEGNSAAHIKASLFGSSVTLIIENGHIRLGGWQGIYFCEFDGPRKREIWVKII